MRAGRKVGVLQFSGSRSSAPAPPDGGSVARWWFSGSQAHDRGRSCNVARSRTGRMRGSGRSPPRRGGTRRGRSPGGPIGAGVHAPEPPPLVSPGGGYGCELLWFHGLTLEMTSVRTPRAKSDRPHSGAEEGSSYTLSEIGR